MIVLCINMYMEDILSVLTASVKCLHFNLQEEGILEHTNGKCHLFTLSSTCRPWWNIGANAPHNTSEHTHAKTLQ